MTDITREEVIIIRDSLNYWLNENELIIQLAEKWYGKDNVLSRGISSSHRQIENIIWHIDNNVLRQR